MKLSLIPIIAVTQGEKRVICQAAYVNYSAALESHQHLTTSYQVQIDGNPLLGYKQGISKAWASTTVVRSASDK